ncbi:NUDIX hydrolase [Flexivirga caeni]|uniref:NUDIX domain-containing protein n=1 Tax=Flexivirga caeni TaxID=2294115 RepID=A0A3M9LXV7_9MICO|nr:NUDIX domain-containing protein [Flexivirga caeni]RNI18072.1 NUDIX domain-containing protein [Flexivirga caeni]
MADKAHIRVKAMAVVVSADGKTHAVARLRPTAENPHGYDRLIGGHIEPGETAREALDREVLEELGTGVAEARLLDVLENIYRINGRLGHEVVFVYAVRLDDPAVIPAEGKVFQDDGDPMPVRWRPVDDTGQSHPLYPPGASELARAIA